MAVSAKKVLTLHIAGITMNLAKGEMPQYKGVKAPK